MLDAAADAIAVRTLFSPFPCAIASRLSPYGKGGKLDVAPPREVEVRALRLTCQKPGKCLQLWLAQVPSCGCMVQSEPADRSGGPCRIEGGLFCQILDIVCLLHMLLTS